MGKNNHRDGKRLEAYLRALTRDGKLTEESYTYDRFELPRFGDRESENCAVELAVGASGDHLFMFEVSVYGDKAARLLSFLRELNEHEEDDEDEKGGVH